MTTCCCVKWRKNISQNSSSCMSKDINIRHNWLFPLPPPSEIGLHLVLPFFNLLPLNIIMLLVEKKIIWMKNRDYCYDDFLFVIFFDHFCCLFVSTYTTAFNNNNNNTHNLGKKIISSIIIIILYYITCWNFPWSILLLYRYRASHQLSLFIIIIPHFGCCCFFCFDLFSSWLMFLRHHSNSSSMGTRAHTRVNYVIDILYVYMREVKIKRI